MKYREPLAWLAAFLIALAIMVTAIIRKAESLDEPPRLPRPSLMLHVPSHFGEPLDEMAVPGEFAEERSGQ